jgi:hypothetical protein
MRQEFFHRHTTFNKTLDVSEGSCFRNVVYFVKALGKITVNGNEFS